MKEFVEKYMCPSLNIHLASYCKGRKKPCVRCDSLDTERKTWSFTKCVPNKQLIYDRRGVTDIREVCAKGNLKNIISPNLFLSEAHNLLSSILPGFDRITQISVLFHKE